VIIKDMEWNCKDEEEEDEKGWFELLFKELPFNDPPTKNADTSAASVDDKPHPLLFSIVGSLFLSLTIFSI
jgi:hypothetical protein